MTQQRSLLPQRPEEPRELPPCFGRYDCRPARAYCCILSLACRLDRALSAARLL